MSPESGKMHHATVLEEAQRLKPRLLEIEAAKKTSARAKHEELVPGVRADFGYDEPEDFVSNDLSDKRLKLEPTITPETLMDVFPITRASADTTRAGRKNYEFIFNQETGRLAVFLGPCSVHDAEQLKTYAGLVRQWREAYGDALEIYLRVYCEKPRTILKKGSEWKGYTYDPYLNLTDDIDAGVIATHLLTCQITDMGVPIVVERLNPTTSQYMDKRVSVDVIGARDSESQRAREYGSGTSSGGILYKNNVEGSIQVAVDAAKSARLPGSFIAMAADGHIAIARTEGNPYAGILLRGGRHRPNYYPRDIKKAKTLLQFAGLQTSIGIDAAHGNSRKNAAEQIKVVRSVARQIALGETAITSVMLESNLKFGKQLLGPLNTLEYGVSVTDECIGIEETELILSMLANAVRKRSMRNPHYYELDA
jgi:3-deoxy-7-phosphoheptulonate synthase